MFNLFGYKFPTTFKEVAHNFTTNSKRELVFLLSLVSLTGIDAHGICFGGKYDCTCTEDCHDEEGCQAMENIGDTLKNAALTIFNLTQFNQSMTQEEKYTAFEKSWSDTQKTTMTQDIPAYCKEYLEPTNASSLLKPSIVTIGLSLASLYFLWEIAPKIAHAVRGKTEATIQPEQELSERRQLRN